MDNQNYYVQEEPKKGLSVASLVCGIISYFCCNPLYLVSIAAVILGIVALCKKESKGMAIAGLVLGGMSILVCFIVDLCLIPFTFGTSFLF